MAIWFNVSAKLTVIPTDSSLADSETSAIKRLNHPIEKNPNNALTPYNTFVIVCMLITNIRMKKIEIQTVINKGVRRFPL